MGDCAEEMAISGEQGFLFSPTQGGYVLHQLSKRQTVGNFTLENPLDHRR